MKRKSDKYLCPISKEMMVDPVVAADGHTYEKSYIMEWMVTNNTSPITREELGHKVLYPNKLLRAEILECMGSGSAKRQSPRAARLIEALSSGCEERLNEYVPDYSSFSSAIFKIMEEHRHDIKVVTAVLRAASAREALDEELWKASTQWVSSLCGTSIDVSAAALRLWSKFSVGKNVRDLEGVLQACIERVVNGGGDKKAAFVAAVDIIGNCTRLSEALWRAMAYVIRGMHTYFFNDPETCEAICQRLPTCTCPLHDDDDEEEQDEFKEMVNEILQVNPDSLVIWKALLPYGGGPLVCHGGMVRHPEWGSLLFVYSGYLCGEQDFEVVPHLNAFCAAAEEESMSLDTAAEVCKVTRYAIGCLTQWSDECAAQAVRGITTMLVKHPHASVHILRLLVACLKNKAMGPEMLRRPPRVDELYEAVVLHGKSITIDSFTDDLAAVLIGMICPDRAEMMLDLGITSILSGITSITSPDSVPLRLCAVAANLYINLPEKRRPQMRLVEMSVAERIKGLGRTVVWVDLIIGMTSALTFIEAGDRGMFEDVHKPMVDVITSCLYKSGDEETRFVDRVIKAIQLRKELALSLHGAGLSRALMNICGKADPCRPMQTLHLVYAMLCHDSIVEARIMFAGQGGVGSILEMIIRHPHAFDAGCMVVRALSRDAWDTLLLLRAPYWLTRLMSRSKVEWVKEFVGEMDKDIP